ncbi:hypothetical protein SRABI106_04857 [Rahnella aquatilis]|nr:hypothetical protein SRABI106_04857 [Rahnella aquatilis]
MAITFTLLRSDANGIASEPTPPAPPMISRVLSADASWILRCSNSASQAVSVVSGMAAASAQFRLCGLTDTIRESISCSVALLPERVISPAYQTSSPALKFFTALPTDLTMPLASQPSTFGASRPLFCTPLCTLVSTGLIDTAFTSTSRS